jgi:hypothetical protein
MAPIEKRTSQRSIPIWLPLAALILTAARVVWIYWG